LRRYPFATVLTPLNPVLWRDDTNGTAYLALVDEIRRQDAGLMTIKTVSRRNWPDGADRSHTTRSPGSARRGRRAAGHASRGRAQPDLASGGQTAAGR
jgi:hypothetical protein